MGELPAFQQYQLAFGAHLRNPARHRRPAGTNARGMGVYRELVYNNLESFLLACFPVCRKMLGKRRWDRLVRAFFAGHRSHTPYFRQIPEEFLQFLQHAWQDRGDYPAYLLELAHYEWVELALSVSNRDEALPDYDPAGDLMCGIPLLNPVLANLAYQWPVHTIRPRARVEPRPSYFLVYRDAGMSVHFVEQTPASARLIGLVESGLSGSEAATQLAAEMGVEMSENLRSFVQQHLYLLRDDGAILGVRKTN